MKPRLIAFYLPQYHPIPENDEWWGKGYTEWRSVTAAKPLFKGHYQPHIPADLGFYDLRLSEIREQQAELARGAGIEGFCYWHYWMGNGRMLLERPFQEVLSSGKPDYPFCLGWANHNWTNRMWSKVSNFSRTHNLIEVFYSKEDYIKHFHYVLPAFRDKRYIRVDGKPLFYIFAPQHIPNSREFIDTWQDLARANGLDGIYFVAMVSNVSLGFKDENGKYTLPNLNEAGKRYQMFLDMGYDGINSRGDYRAELLCKGKYVPLYERFLRKVFKYSTLKRYDYAKVMENLFVKEDAWENVFPTIIPNWDRSPRAGKDAVIYDKSTPDLFERSLRNAINIIKDKKPEHQIIFVKSWNEWGEGNHLEPDVKWGHQYLDAIHNVIFNKHDDE